MTQTAAAPPGTTRPESPYVGLNYFTEHDADIFFGRERELETIITNIGVSRLTLLYAQSGVGKSSLLRAGVAPKLRKLAEESPPGQRRYIPVVFSSWSEQPTATLIDCIEQVVRDARANAEIELPRNSLDTAIEAAADELDVTLLVVLDQFEEYFVYRSREATQGMFADELARCVNRPDLRANFLIALREDSYAGLGDLFKGRIPNVYANYLHLEFLERDAARDAIVKPIDRFNEIHPDEPPVEIEPELVEAVLTQVPRGKIVIGEAGLGTVDGAVHGDERRFVDTPNLQLVMERLWNEELRHGSRRLRLATLQALGGADTIIRTHLDEVMDKLPEAEQDAAAAALRFLVTPDRTKIALSVTALADFAEVPYQEVEDAIKRLSGDVRILRPVAVPGQVDGSRYEIYHDALADPVLDWRARYERRKEDAEREAHITQERAEKEEAQREALEAQQREATERRRKRIAIVALAVVVIAVIASAVAGFVIQRHAADARAKVNESLRAVTRATQLRPKLGPGVAGLSGLEAYRLSPTFEARNLILAQLQVNAALPRVAVGHTRGVNTVAWLNPATLGSGGDDGTVRLWSRAGRQLGRPLVTYTKSDHEIDNAVVKGMAVIARGGRVMLAAARGNGNIDLWDVTDPNDPLHLDSFHGSSALFGDSENAVAFSPDGKTLAGGGDYSPIKLWDVSQLWDPSKVLKPRLIGSREAGGGFQASVQALAFSSDGRLLASASDAGVQKWKVSDFSAAGRRSKPRTLQPKEAAQAVSWAPDGSLAAGIAGTYGVRRWRPGEMRSRTFFPATALVRSLAFLDGSSVLVSAGDDFNVTTWDVKTGRSFGPPRTEAGYRAVNGIAVSPDGQTIASGGADGLVKLWPVAVSRPLASTVLSLPSRNRITPLPEIEDLAVGSAGLVAAAADEDGTFVWSLVNARGDGRPLHLLHIPARFGSSAAAFHGDSLATTDFSSFTLWNPGPSCRTMPGKACRLGPATNQFGSDPISSIAFDRSGTLLAAGHDDGTVDLWDVSEPHKPKRVWRQNERYAIGEIAFSPTLDVLAVAGDDGKLRLWDVRNHSRPSQLGEPLVGHGNQAVVSLAFAPNGRLLASGGGDQQVVFWDIDPDKGATMRPQTLTQSNTIDSLAFSPDGKTLAAGDGDSGICLYDVKSLLIVGGDDCLLGHYSGYTDSSIDALRFVRGGATLLSAGRGNPVVAWNSILWSRGRARPTLERLTAATCQLAGRNLTTDEWKDVFGFTRLVHHRHQTCA